MKQRFRRFSSLILTLVFTLALSASALAADVVILHTNDIHCGVEDNVGVARLSQYKKDLKKQGLAVLLVDAGDAVQGAPIGKLSKGESIVNIMTAIGYDFLIPGNHEFDYGVPRLKELLEQVGTPVACANFFEAGEPQPVYAPYVIHQYGDKKVAYVGAVTPETMILEGYSFYDTNGILLYDLKPKTFYQLIQQAVRLAGSAAIGSVPNPGPRTLPRNDAFLQLSDDSIRDDLIHIDSHAPSLHILRAAAGSA